MNTEIRTIEENPITAQLPEKLVCEHYDRTSKFKNHSITLLMEAGLNAWEYILLYCVREANQTSEAPNCTSWENGVVELRHTIISMAPSILFVYDELYKINDDLPCYDFEVVPAIVRYLDRYLVDFASLADDKIISQELAKSIAILADKELH